MKKIHIVTLSLVATSLLVACGGITVKGENGQTFESYQECCAAQDFMAAHTYLAKMEAKIDGDEIKQEEYKTAKEYVFKQEALYLMSIGDDAAKKRISYLLKEEGGNDSHVAMLIDLAIENDDEDFVKILVNQLQKDDGECIAKVIEYLSRKSNDDNLDYIEQIVKKHLSLKSNKILNYLASTNNRENDEMIIGLLTAKQQEITQKPNSRFDAYYSDGDAFCENYVSSVKKYNASCQKILGIAIKHRNKVLAQRAVSLFRSNIHWERGEYNYNTHNNTYKVSIDNNELNEAKATLNEAIRSGAFK